VLDPSIEIACTDLGASGVAACALSALGVSLLCSRCLEQAGESRLQAASAKLDAIPIFPTLMPPVGTLALCA
jgi:hypothetical protein